jgi:hypothetical protein
MILVGFEVFSAVVMKSIIFWDVTPCSLPPACLLVLAEMISSTLKMEAICSSETPVTTQQTTRRHIQEDDTLQYDSYWTDRVSNAGSLVEILSINQQRVPRDE